MKPDVAIYTAPTGRRYVSANDIATLTGICVHRLDLQYRPHAWATPRDFRWVPSTGRLWFAEASLPQLVDALFDGAQPDAALRLREWLSGHLAGAAAAIADSQEQIAKNFDVGNSQAAPLRKDAAASTPPGRAAHVESQSWIHQWEQAHER